MIEGTITIYSYPVRDEKEIEVTIVGKAYYAEGRTSGPPENCYPSESGVQLLSVTGEDGRPFELTDAEIAEAEDRVFTAVMSDECYDVCDDEDYDDSDDEEDDYKNELDYSDIPF